MPRVSVIMAVYNDAPFLQAALSSILDQTMRDIEIIVVDDGSTDETPEILAQIRDPRVRVVHQPNQGHAASLNRAIRLASCELLARMDDDDASTLDRLEKQVGFMDSHPEVVAVGSFATLMTVDGESLCVAARPTDHARMLALLRAGNSPFFHGSVMYRRSAFIAAGGYPEMKPEDVLIWARMAQIGRLANLPEALYWYRIRPGSLGSVSARQAVRRQRILRRVVANTSASESDLRTLDEINQSARLLSDARRRGTYHRRLGNVRLDMGDVAGARREFAIAVRLEPLSLRAWFGLAVANAAPGIRRVMRSARQGLRERGLA
jgi:glycosyltransferase involved in cell wall biosynthesis